MRKMEVFQKLPSLNEELQGHDKAITLSDREWKEIRTLLDTEYDRFTTRLQDRWASCRKHQQSNNGLA